MDMPSYEAGLIDGLNRNAKTGDRIVIVGAGIGITVAVALKKVGSTGSVKCIEGSSDCLGQTKQTLSLNNLTGQAQLFHAIVGEDISVYKSKDVAEVLPASDLPDCDLLELDCEGAEVKILREMTIRPKTILVETHGTHGAPTNVVWSLLEDLGYTVQHLGVAEPYLEDYCNERDIMVLEGLRN